MRFVVLALTALALAGCVTATNTLSPDQVASFRLVKVEISAPDTAPIRWGDGEVAYASTKGVAPHDAGTVANSPEGRAYVRAAVASKLKGALEKELLGSLTGSRPVRLEVTVQNLEVTPAIQRILIGGAHNMRADATLVDAKTGAVLLQFHGQTANAAAGEGLLGTLVEHAAFDAPIDRVVASYAEQYRRWLKRS